MRVFSPRASNVIWILIAVLLSGYVATSAQTDPSSTKPRLVSRFRDSDNEWYKLMIGHLNEELSGNPQSRALIRVKNDKGLLRRLQLLRKGSVFAKLDEQRLTYLIVNSQDYDAESYIFDGCAAIPPCDGCTMIRALDFDALDKLFRFRRIARRT